MENDKIDISLIIPVYNVEKYLHRALRSVENQTFDNFEVIIVNDGSTDNSMKIVEEFVNRNKNFSVISQENKGLSEARNVGLRHSRGQYIAFLDSDDFLEPNYLETLYLSAIKTCADIVCCNFYFYYENTKLRIWCPINTIPGVYSSEKAMKKITSCVGTFHFAWNKLYRRSLFTDHKIEFQKMYFEDCVTSPVLFFYAHTVTFINKCLYNYVMRENSILHTMNAQKINDFVRSIGINRDFYEKKGIYKKYKRRFKRYALRLNFLITCDIFMMHFKCTNFSGLIKNFRAFRKSIKHFTSDKYKSGSSHSPEILYPVKDPGIDDDDKKSHKSK